MESGWLPKNTLYHLRDIFFTTKNLWRQISLVTSQITFTTILTVPTIARCLHIEMCTLRATITNQQYHITATADAMNKIMHFCFQLMFASLIRESQGATPHSQHYIKISSMKTLPLSLSESSNPTTFCLHVSCLCVCQQQTQSRFGTQKMKLLTLTILKPVIKPVSVYMWILAVCSSLCVCKPVLYRKLPTSRLSPLAFSLCVI